MTTIVRTGPIRYATAARFALPVGVSEQTPSSGEISPQPPSRLDRVMGPPRDRLPQGEDCLNLTVTTPGLDDGRRPVLVWLHGGGFSSGGGLLDWYDGGALAAEGDLVVVGVNYRLGALGYLYLDGVSPGNLGLADQLEALRWVRANIAAYGGDPDNVTVAGQSAGGISIRLLMDLPEARGLFRRAILQSAPLGLATRRPEHAAKLGQVFADALGSDPHTAGITEILAAHKETALTNLRLTGDPMEPAFVPVDTLDKASFVDNVRDLDVLYGWNANDMTAFPGAAGTDEIYVEPLAAFGDRLRSAGAGVWSYRLDWRPEGSEFGATHCVELPLLLGTQRAWQDSPMLGKVPWPEVDAFGAALRSVWATFARAGTLDPTPVAGHPIRFNPELA
ncbi:carboxylesterase family protein [Amycolatopsis roodepoortensis]|uniref:carboxylesterase family protein n=1 Tax=Amycolatopsis roodepoortensis TaxID=700274 RepID=UPI00214BDCCE|nr:carboxylesterase family protein [Amycolatopsis roodepoortensis]UUV32034.1 carboxylesterase family protein [Amycolatopsis roodepoortensis]